MNLARLLTYVAMAFLALFVLRRILMMVRGGISVNDLAELKAKGAQVIDVRTTIEFSGGAAPGSRNIPLDQLSQRMNELDRTKPVIFCCASGARSASAQRFLQQAGFTEVFNAGPWQRVV
ncbi:MAG: rhodanese-like domain-containing protein [Holophaga sp.]|nr:rhodanese-like domain-containing protein [Holophaga sp.]